MNSKENQEARNANERKNSEKIKFFEDNFNQIVDRERDLRFALSEVEIKKDPFLVLKHDLFSVSRGHLFRSVYRAWQTCPKT